MRVYAAVNVSLHNFLLIFYDIHQERTEVQRKGVDVAGVCISEDTVLIR